MGGSGTRAPVGLIGHRPACRVRALRVRDQATLLRPLEASPMSSAETAAPVDVVGTKPADAKEFTFRSVVVAIAVAAVIGASYPYVVLKLGFGPNSSVVS